MSSEPSIHSPQDVNSVRVALAAAYDDVLGRLPDRLRDASARLLPRVRSKAADRSHWATTFSRLTATYPTLQAATALDPGLIESANLAHLLLLVYTFVDDRITDRQLDPQPDEREFADEMRAQAVRILDEVGGHSATTCYRHAFERYTASKTRSAADEKDPPESMAAAERLAIDRAALGGVAARVLEAAAVLPPGAPWEVQQAYDALAVGLQWIDDAEDWHEDLLRREDNLLLLQLRRKGYDAYAGAPDERKVATAAAVLLSADTVSIALDRSLQWLDLAATMQSSLGRHLLEFEILALMRSVSASRSRLMFTAAETALN